MDTNHKYVTLMIYSPDQDSNWGLKERIEEGRGGQEHIITPGKFLV